MTTRQHVDPVAMPAGYQPHAVVEQLAATAAKSAADSAVRASLSPALGALHDATVRLELAHKRAVPNTLVADVEGLRFGGFDVPARYWPLVDELGVPLVQGQPLVRLGEVPTVETPGLEKSPLGGTTIKVVASNPTNPTDHALFTDISLQAASNPSVVDAVTGIMSASLAAAVDAAAAATLAAAGTATGSLGEALAAVSDWPGQRLVVLSPSAVGDVVGIVALADMSRGAVTVIVDPFVADNLVIARVGVAVGVLGMETLAANRPSHLGVDRATYAGLAVESAAGAVATWPTTL